MALHVVQGCIREGLRKPMYILRRCRLVPFLSRNSSMLYCELIIYKECHIMKHNSNPRRVLSASSHYQVLGVARDASKKDINKAYREMALKYHPDKNSMPQAKEVFNRVVNSYNILSDDAQRRIHDDQMARPKQFEAFKPQKGQRAEKNAKKSTSYFKSHYYDDQFRKERQIPKKTYQQNRSQQQNTENNNEFTKKFKKPFPPKQNNAYKSQANDRPKYRGSYNNKKNSNGMVLLIVFALMIIWFFSPSLIQERQPLFVLKSNPQYSLKLKTKILKAPYFVKSDYDPLTQISEEVIERAYVRQLQRQCEKSLNQKKSYERLAQKAIDAVQQATLIAAASGVNLKPCKKIITLIKKHPTIKLTTFTNNIIGL